MPAFGPIKRNNLIRAFRDLGFSGPFPGGKHQYMLRGTLKVRIPNPHQGVISTSLLARLLKQAEITKNEWEEI